MAVTSGPGPDRLGVPRLRPARGAVRSRRRRREWTPHLRARPLGRARPAGRRSRARRRGRMPARGASAAVAPCNVDWKETVPVDVPTPYSASAPPATTGEAVAARVRSTAPLRPKGPKSHRPSPGTTSRRSTIGPSAAPAPMQLSSTPNPALPTPSRSVARTIKSPLLAPADSEASSCTTASRASYGEPLTAAAPARICRYQLRCEAAGRSEAGTRRRTTADKT